MNAINYFTGVSRNVRDDNYYFVSSLVVGNGYGAKPWWDVMDAFGSCRSTIRSSAFIEQTGSLTLDRDLQHC